MATPKLVITAPKLVISAELATNPVSCAAELSMLNLLVQLAVQQAVAAGGGNAGGDPTSGTVNLPAATAGGSAAGTASWAYTPIQAS